MPRFDSLGPALRYLRLRRNLKQYQVAENAGVTRAMLCAYERGSREPSLTTLGKVLDALGADLDELAAALESQGAAASRTAARGVPVRVVPATLPPLEVLLGVSGPLEAEERQALTDILGGFLRWLRFLHGTSRRLRPRSAE